MQLLMHKRTCFLNSCLLQAERLQKAKWSHEALRKEQEMQSQAASKRQNDWAQEKGMLQAGWATLLKDQEHLKWQENQLGLKTGAAHAEIKSKKLELKSELEEAAQVWDAEERKAKKRKKKT